jgi:hypothetical protein
VCPSRRGYLNVVSVSPAGGTFGTDVGRALEPCRAPPSC